MPTSQRIWECIFIFPDFVIFPIAVGRMPEVAAFLGMKNPKWLSYSGNLGCGQAPLLEWKEVPVWNPGSAVN